MQSETQKRGVFNREDSIRQMRIGHLVATVTRKAHQECQCELVRVQEKSELAYALWALRQTAHTSLKCKT